MNSQPETYLVRPSIRMLFYSLLISLCTGFVAFKFREVGPVYLCALSSVMFLFFLTKFIFPAHMVWSSKSLKIPRFFPGKFLILNLEEISSGRLVRVKGILFLYIKMKNGTVHAVDTTQVSNWNQFYEKFSELYPETPVEQISPAAKTRLLLFVAMVWLGLGICMQKELLDQQTVLLAGLFSTGLVFMAIFAKRK